VPFTRRPPLSLDGRWQLELVDVLDAPHPPTAEVEVPGSWTLQVPGCELAHGTVRYRRSFSVPLDWPQEGTLVLRFGAVNHAAVVTVDGVEAGRHEGGWTPFEVELDPALLTGTEQVLEVEVHYPPLLPQDPATVSLQEVPHGKQTWYGTAAGIWQPVVLEHRPRQHLADLAVRTDAASGRLTACVGLARPGQASERVRLVVRERTGTGDGPVVARAEGQVADDRLALELVAVVPQAATVVTGRSAPVRGGGRARRRRDGGRRLRPHDGLPDGDDQGRQRAAQRRARRAARRPGPGHPPGQRVPGRRGAGARGAVHRRQAARVQPAALPHQAARPGLLRDRRTGSA
jgi:hypothetical protein